jgi:DNA-binding NarL/FixJ family response regulator
MALSLAPDQVEPELRLLPVVRRPARVDFERLVWRWEDALAIYRRAVESYNTVLTIRARLRRADAAAEQVAVTSVVEVAQSAAPPAMSSKLMGQLTRREIEVAKLIMQGLTNRQIADALVITQGTAANHVAHVLEKLNAANRTQVAVIMQMWEQPPPPTCFG